MLLLAWLPVLLAYWPGLFAYDSNTQTKEFLTGQYNTHHPVAHTLLFSMFYRFGQWANNYNLGMVLYTIFQMILFALSIVSVLLFLRRVDTCKAFQLFLLSFFCFMPFISVLSISMTKDVLFAAAFAHLFVLFCYALVQPDLLGKRRFQVHFVLTGIATILMRHNGTYAILASAICIILFLRGMSQKRLFALACTALILGVGTQTGLEYIVQAKHFSTNVMFCVPYQQIARIYNDHRDKLTPDEIKNIEWLIPDVEDYLPYKADPLVEKGKIAEDLPKAISLYLQLIKQYPSEGLAAFLHVTRGFWDLRDVTHAAIYGSGLEGRQGYLLTDTKWGYNIQPRSLFPALEKLYEHLFSANEYLDMPLYRYLFTPALYMWLMLLALSFLFAQKQWPILASVGLIVGLLVTLFLGYCALIRYALPYILCIPPLYVLVFRQTDLQ